MFSVVQVAGSQAAVLAVVERSRMSRNDTPDCSRRPGVYLSKAIMSGKKIAVPDEIYERVQQRVQQIATVEGTTVEELATKALERDLARRWLERIGREGELRRGDLTDDESRLSSSGRSRKPVPAREASRCRYERPRQRHPVRREAETAS